MQYRVGNCAHCGNERRLYARGLCTKCYTTPAIRARFPPKPGGRKPEPVECFSGAVGVDPTCAPPGSAAKIATMAARAALRRPVFVAGDERINED